MSEYVKDPASASGWKTISYGRKQLRGDGAPVTAEGMDEEGGGTSDGDEAPDED
jgi:hypothetical protein